MRRQNICFKKHNKKLILCFLFLFYSCQVFGQNIFKKPQVKTKTYTGWWIYGEGLHIFKNEITLEEYNLKFEQEKIEDLNLLYLDICQMEYFPMECEVTGYFDEKNVKKPKTFIVVDFEVLYIEGCGE